MTQLLIMGAGYVGLAHALLFSRNPNFQVTIADIDLSKVELINKGKSPLAEQDITEALAKEPQNLRAVLTSEIDYQLFDAIFLCLPTNYDEALNQFDTTILDRVLEDILLKANYDRPVIIKSTLPIGYTQSRIDAHQAPNLLFSPEFLREGQALRDNIYPSRLVLGGKCELAKEVSSFYLSVIETPDVPVLFMSPTEAESVKLFANTYLAMRVAFFNELDTFSEVHGLDSASIIKAVGLDERIGRFYNNPSFGYGGYCLPKDSKQLRSNFSGIPGNLIGAIVASNDSRKEFIADRLLAMNAPTIGVYRLAMKQSSDNSREASVLDIMERLKSAGRKILVFEPDLSTTSLANDFEFTQDLEFFKKESDVILANRWHQDLGDVRDKVYSRDIFQMD